MLIPLPVNSASRRTFSPEASSRTIRQPASNPSPEMTTVSPDMSNYDMARQVAPVVNTGVDNYTAGLESNNANPMGGLI